MGVECALVVASQDNELAGLISRHQDRNPQLVEQWAEVDAVNARKGGSSQLGGISPPSFTEALLPVKGAAVPIMTVLRMRSSPLG